jgi:hypothetical protein
MSIAGYLAMTSATALAAGNLLPNGDFEGSGSGSLAGWKAASATLTLVPGDGGGFGARVAFAGGAPSFAILTSAKPVKSTKAGAAYIADGRFKAASGKMVCLKVRETGTLPGSASSCALGNGAWASLPELTYTANADGDGLIYSVVEKHPAAGDAFVVDNLSLATGAATIAAAGDIACSPRDPHYNNGNGTGDLLTGACHQKATADLIAQGSYDRVLPLGDNQYDCGSLTSYTTVYDATWGQFNSKAEPVLGNHEVTTVTPNGDSGCSTQATGYFTYFANHGVTDAAGVNGKGYYSYDLGTWHVLAINSNCTFVGGCGAGSPEETWIRNDLATHPAACTLAYWHHAPWSTSGGGVAKLRTFWADMVNAGVDLVLVGHFHHYERFADLNATGQPVTTGARTREIIAGTGGKNQGSFGTPIAGSEVRIRAFGILALTMDPGSYSWQFKPADPSGPTDSGTEACH